MYFPYLRGRQFELIALRELSEYKLLGPHIIPIVEPVKLSSTLCMAIESYAANEQPIALIHNPTVGSFMSDMGDENKEKNRMRFSALMGNPRVIKAHQMNPYSSMQLVTLESEGVRKQDIFVLNTNRESLDIYEKEFAVIMPRYTFIPDESVFRRKVRRQRVLIDDKFNKKGKNAEYQETDDEFFSDDHLYYRDDGFLGFADYSVIGDEYLEKGFAPYAVAIHIVYFADDESLRIHHFVSDSNEDATNPAGKFYEALKKLAAWCKIHPIDHSMGLSTFLEHYANGTYPGLGTVKKLSIMHHLEIIGKYLSRKEDAG
ncbi:sce7725 family protein [Pelotomaculum terephthalicicum JT]|uniref:sce7725 family protein n=1 Tax=Pelotomaculum terephthalicicum TaxID=206393 RepID=UPI0009D00B0E|nr:sce7725 family protein [Pelotomaculum terephthalicicum]MCG9967439.1 sce7725 family protein [Pelotomaculum terephthalicicum JT]OPY61627.1 MAG: hypothetical protein A4E56_01928 [Pelotomaculum sp. PtaU1.Bin065]